MPTNNVVEFCSGQLEGHATEKYGERVSAFTIPKLLRILKTIGDIEVHFSLFRLY